MEGEKLIENN